MRIFVGLCVLLLSFQAWAYEIHDGHLHYNKDIWHLLPPEDVLLQLNESQIDRAIISSTPAEGTLNVYKLAPQRIIPFLRPYLTPRDAMVWYKTPSMVDYVRTELANKPFMGFGEFHIFEIEHVTPIVESIMGVVAEKGIPANAHVNVDTLEKLIELQPGITLIWAHCGFDHPVADIERLFNQYPNLYCDLSLREQMFDEDDQLTPEWKAILENHAERFMVGMDTYKTIRWERLPEYAEETRNWLDQLEPVAADAIARGNIDRLFPLN